MNLDFNWSSFIEVPGFTKRWADIGCEDEDLRQLQLDLLEDPKLGAVVKLAGGWRKVRFAPPSWGKGKSGAVRVYYADLPQFGLILLGTAFAKSEMSDLSAKGKVVIAKFLAEFCRNLGESNS